MATGAVTPPQGFVLEGASDPQGPIALPAGFHIEEGSAASTLPANKQAPQQHSFAEDVTNGFGSAAGESLISLGKLGSHIPGVRYVADAVGDAAGLPKLTPGSDPYQAVEKETLEARQQALSSLGGKIGSGIEGIAEWAGGEELLKGLSVAERLGIAAKLAKLAESHPAIAKVINMGLNGVRNSSLGTAQGGLHGETAGQAITGGVVAGGTGAALEGASEGIRVIAPKVKELAGVYVPVRASQDSSASAAAENLARSKSLESFNVSQTQPAAKQVIGKVASDVQGAAARKLASDTMDFQAAAKEIGGGKPFAELAPSDQSRVLLRAQELKLARNNLAPAVDLGDAAEQVRSQAKPVFAKLDELTAGRDAKFSDIQNVEKSAWRRGDVQAAFEAKGKQQAIIDEFKDQFAPDELTKARAAWSQASALDRVNTALNTKSVLRPSPVEFRPKGAPDPGMIDGKAFSRQIIKLRNDGVLTSAGLTPEHVQTLEDLGSLLENSANTRKLNRLVLGGGAAAELFGLAVHPAAAVSAATAVVPGYAMSLFLGRAMTDPAFAETAIKALKAGARIAPPVAVQGTRAIFDGTKNSLSQ
jgi:hypothetical protein